MLNPEDKLPSPLAPAPAVPVGTPARLFLVGMPGAGKTTLGRALAALYALPFLDLDEEIVRREGRSIPALFEEQGEAWFREAEAAALRDVLSRHERLVLATGGGTPCFHQNMECLLQAGLVLWLDVPVPELVARLRHAATARPLLAALPDEAALAQRLHATLDARKLFYAQAQVRCAPPACTPEVVREFLARYLHTA